jgi:hypothetical protein
MLDKATKLILALLLAFVCAQAGLSGRSDHSLSRFAGTWEGSVNDQPAVKLTLTAEGGKVDGTIIFYFQRLGKDGKWHVEGDDAPQALIAPRVDGNILTFEVPHHKKHGGTELGPNKKYRLEVIAANEARFREAGDPTDLPGRGLKLTHTR